MYLELPADGVVEGPNEVIVDRWAETNMYRLHAKLFVRNDDISADC